MKTTLDLTLNIQIFLQWEGYAPTLNDLNHKKETDPIQDTLGLYEEEPYTQEIVDEAAANGWIAEGKDGRLYLLAPLHKFVADEQSAAKMFDHEYKDYIKKMIFEHYYKWTTEGLLQVPPKDTENENDENE
ncbi:MAG: hypothetical protein FWH48_03015 [Oscillospiraceae bacterium]|nr:hypothetical protein [Oscillospiraceae bacterium]